MENNSNVPKTTGYKITIAILSIACLIMAYFLSQKQETIETQQEQYTQLDLEKQAVENELTDMLHQYEAMEVENDEMRAQIDEQKEKIEQLIKKAKDNSWTISKLKKETESLRTIMKGYVRTIDSLNTANQELIAKNQQAQQQVKEVEGKYTQLSKVKEELASKVALGSQLKAIDMIVVGQSEKRSNTYRETNRASKTDKLKVCFTLDDNKIAKPGKRTVHVRIIDPNGKVLAKENTEANMFEFEGVKGLYTIAYDLLYENEELDICLFWDVMDELAPGKYITEIYVGDYLAGTETIILD